MGKARIGDWNDENVENITVYEPAVCCSSEAADEIYLFYLMWIRAIDEAEMIFYFCPIRASNLMGKGKRSGPADPEMD